MSAASSSGSLKPSVMGAPKETCTRPFWPMMPANRRSGALLARLGFEQEGYARDYLMINGRWEDHVLTALLNPAG